MPTDKPTPVLVPPSEEGSDLLDRFEEVLPGHRELGAALLARYQEPHRRYHDVGHLRFVLDQIDALSGRDHDLFVVRLAAWFHDAVYDVPTRELSNEEASARLAIRELGRVGLEQEDLGEISRIIRMTQTHKPGSRDPNGNLLSDADLAVLAGTPEEYAAYVAAVRAEYAKVSDEDFDRGRFAVLFPLAASQLFRTGRGHKLEAAAHTNLDAEIGELADRLGLDLEELDPASFGA
ncbi:MAG: HD domain-containing protein [Propionibacteriaceae bacterium]